MDISEKAREQLTGNRQHDEHVQDNMQSRTQAEVDHAETGETVSEQAREALTEQLHHTDQRQKNMRERAEEG